MKTIEERYTEAEGAAWMTCDYLEIELKGADGSTYWLDLKIWFSFEQCSERGTYIELSHVRMAEGSEYYGAIGKECIPPTWMERIAEMLEAQQKEELEAMRDEAMDRKRRDEKEERRYGM